MKLHVCVDARMIGAAGIGTLLKTSLLALSKELNLELSLLCCEKDMNMLCCFSERLIAMDSPIYSLKEQFEYVKKIPRCDLFWAPHFNVPVAPIKAKKRATTICDVYHLAHFSSLTLSQKIYAQMLYNAAFILSDTILTISNFSKNEILKWAFYKPKQLEVLPPTLHMDPFKNSCREDFVLFVGNLKPHKNLLRLVKAYALLKPKNPLYIVGKKDGLITADNQLFIEVEKNPYLKSTIHFLGTISENRLRDLYLKAALFVFPSTYEGFGYPPLEAMSFDCPVVASNTASIPEICKDAVEYVDPYSITSIASGIKRLLCDAKRREELILKGRELIEKKRNEKNRLAEVIYACCRRT